MFSSVLVANRGEIACRVIRACRALGLRALAVYSEVDRHAPHVELADASFLLGPAPAAQSYLNQERILEAAEALQAEAVHPGYGFLSENATFARECEQRGLVFVGPRPESIAAMGEKMAARQLADSIGVRIVPGTREPLHEGFDASAIARELGYPVLVKPSAGGGGIGMSVAHDASELDSAIRTARSRAQRAFRSGEIFLERFLERPHHVEIQVFGDPRGNVVHLFERECSVQRRYQKVIEETPSPAVSHALRERLTTDALKMAHAVQYVNAGTVEFIVDDSEQAYFLEMNTRLQVEHAITEAVTGCDLVQAQLLVAGGHDLPWRQSGLAARGNALECRVYAEDPLTFLPSPGSITHYAEPLAEDVRVDSGVRNGSEVSVFYDPLLAKVITWGDSRPAAIDRMVEALTAFEIEGVKTNIPLHLRVLGDSSFVNGAYDTSLLERMMAWKPVS